MKKIAIIFLLTGLIFFDLALISYAQTPSSYPLPLNIPQSTTPYIESQVLPTAPPTAPSAPSCFPPEILINGKCQLSTGGSVSGYTMSYDFPCDPKIGSCPEATTPAGYVSRLYTFSLMAAGIAALGALIFGAVKYILSAGNIVSQQDARDQMTNAIWGLVLLIGAYLILYTINPDLVNLRNPSAAPINVENVGGSGGGTGGGAPNAPSVPSASAPTGTPSAPPTQTGCKRDFSSGAVTINGVAYRLCMDCDYPAYYNENGVCKPGPEPGS